MLGHTRMETTQIYTHVNIEALARIHATSHPHGRLGPDHDMYGPLKSTAAPPATTLETQENNTETADSSFQAAIPVIVAPSVMPASVLPPPAPVRPAEDSPPTRRDTPPDDDPPDGNATIRPITPPQGPNGGGSCNSLDLNKLDPNPTSVGTMDVTYYGYRWFDPVTGRWPSRDPIGESGGGNLYGFVYNNPMAGIDLKGLSIVAPPEGFLGDIEEDCKWFSYEEFVQLQVEWGAKLTNKEKLTLAMGCIGVCKVAQGDGRRDGYPENIDGTKCWGGASGRGKAEAAAKECKSGTNPVVFAKHGKWVGDAIGDGEPAPPNSVTGDESINNFDYITKLGSFYISASEHVWKNPNGRPGSSNIDEKKKEAFRICKKQPSKQGYSAEIWCYRCCSSNRGIGYHEGY
jgi:RHS repeat-associated protein